MPNDLPNPTDEPDQLKPTASSALAAYLGGTVDAPIVTGLEEWLESIEASSPGSTIVFDEAARLDEPEDR